MTYYYVYRIQSTSCPNKIYTGFTRDISARLKAHNLGKNRYTAHFRPWKLLTLFTFTEVTKAKDFERYLKTGSGRAFSKRHL